MKRDVEKIVSAIDITDRLNNGISFTRCVHETLCHRIPRSETVVMLVHNCNESMYCIYP
jgi:hypothetical protein